MIKYLGSKRTLLADLVALLGQFPEFTSVIDLFSGTSRVGHALKRVGYQVYSNDHNAYAHCLASCYVEADFEDVAADAQRLIAELNALPGADGYFTETYCLKSRFFQPHNGARIDAIRDAIEAKDLDPLLKSVLLVSLMEAADRVDSTCGLQMAYVKQWAQRSYNPLSLRMPEVLPRVAHGPCSARCMDAREAARVLKADVAYLDPPYNQHSYLGNYHIWESLVLWDKSPVYGVACKRVDVRERKSDFNSKRRHLDAFSETFLALDCPLIVVSFNNEGYQTRAELEALLSTRGQVFVVSKDFKRYVGAQIGIYNPTGDRVGDVTHLRNTEFIYLVATEGCSRIPGFLNRLQQAVALANDAHPAAVASSARLSSPGRTRATNTEALRDQILLHVRMAGSASQLELQQALDLSEYHVRLHLSSLVSQGALAKQSKGKSIRYSVAAPSANTTPDCP